MKEPRKLQVDIEALASVDHECDCCKGKGSCCCSRYDVLATKKELSGIIGILPTARKYAKHLDESNDLFEEAECGMYSLETDDDGLCVFAYECGQEIRCALHSAAIEEGLLPASVKPLGCTLWPLSISGLRFGAMSIVDEVSDFHCIEPRSVRSKQISPVLLSTIESLYGPDVRNGVCQAAAESLPEKAFFL